MIGDNNCEIPEEDATSLLAITGTGWTGTLPAGVQEYKSPTAIVWLLGRIYASVSSSMVHMPVLPNPAFIGKTGNGDWADCLAEMDYRTGQILDASRMPASKTTR